MYSFQLEAESTPGSWCSRIDYVNEKFKWHHRNRNHDLLACRAVSQPTASPRVHTSSNSLNIYT